MSYLGTLSLVLITTALAGHFSRRVGMPAVIGELLVGIVLGPAVLGLVTNNSFVHTFSEIGVIILMFIAGLESDLELLKKYLKPAFSVAVCGVIVPVGLVFLDGLQALCVGRRKCRQLKITRSFDAVHQSFGRRAAVVVDDGNAQVLYFQCGSPGHDQHHHAGKKQDETGQETVAFQLLEFFFYQVT